MKKILALSLGSIALVSGLSSCTYDDYGQLRYGQTESDTASIWNRAARYGYGQPQNVPPRAMRYDPSGYVYQSPYPYGGYTNSTGVNRYGAGAYANSGPQQYQPGEPARLSGTVSGAEREMRRQRELQAQLDRQEWEDQQRRFREEGQRRDGIVSDSTPLRREVPRFNPSSQDRPVSGELPQMSTRNSGSDSLASSSGSSKSSSSNSNSTQSTAKKETPASLPFAVPVPGKTGYVTLPAPNNNLPEIDVRGIAPGTPVEIPDPNRAGKTIQFKVP